MLRPESKHCRIALNCSAAKYKTNYPPYGYLKGTDKNCTPIVDPYSAGGRDVDEYIRRMKSYAGATKLTRDMTLELIEYIKVDAHPGHRNLPRTIHTFYKLIDYK